MEKEVLKSFENDDVRIRVYYDNCSWSPNHVYDMLGVMLFTYDNGKLHKECDARELYGKWCDCYEKYTIKEALAYLAMQKVTHNNIVKFLKEGCEHYKLQYNRSKRAWQFLYNANEFGNNDWKVEHTWLQSYFQNGDCDINMLVELEEYELVELINKYGNNIIATSLTTYGSCQGDIQEMFAYCTKERFNELHSKPGKDWKEKAVECMKNELKECGCWMWGNVYRVEVEEKVWFTKKYADGVECEDFEYRDAECGQTFYCEYSEDALEWVKQDYVHD